MLAVLYNTRYSLRKLTTTYLPSPRRYRHTGGATSGGVFDRIDHISIYADDRQGLSEFLSQVLALERLMPHQHYAFGQHDVPFELDMLHLGGGVGVEVYTDSSLAEWRTKFGRAPCSIANLALKPCANSIDRATSMMLRRNHRTRSMPVAYHFTDEQRAEQPDLPRWLCHKLPIQIGNLTHMEEGGAEWAARMQDIPQLAYFFLVAWHKDLPWHPAAVRRRLMHACIGPAQICGLNTVYWSVPSEEQELLDIALQMRAFGMPVTQRATNELRLHFIEGPDLHITAESLPSRLHLRGRITGWELAVADIDAAAAALQAAGVHIQDASAGVAPAWAPAPQAALMREATESVSRPDAGETAGTAHSVVPAVSTSALATGATVAASNATLPAEVLNAAPGHMTLDPAPRFVVDTAQFGAPGLYIHFVQATPGQLRLAQASAVYTAALPELKSLQAQLSAGKADAAPQQLPQQSHGSQQGDSAGTGDVPALPMPLQHGQVPLASSALAITDAAVPGPLRSAFLAADSSVVHAPPMALAMSGRITTLDVPDVGGRPGRLMRYNDRPKLESVSERHELAEMREAAEDMVQDDLGLEQGMWARLKRWLQYDRL